MNKESTESATQSPSTWHWPLFIWGMVIMVVVNAWPAILVNPATGQTSHGMVTFVLLSMSASFVRGVGFIPHHRIARLFLGSWAALAYALLAGCLYYWPS